MSQGANIATLLKVGASSIFPPGSGAPALPGPAREARVHAPSEAMVRDFVRWTGGDPKSWRDEVPPTLFAQWAFPVLSETLAGVPYRLTSVLNQGCGLTVNAPIRPGEPLKLTARLVEIREDERRARLHQQIVTGTAESPEALVADVYAVVPLRSRGGEGKGGARRPRPQVPEGAREFGSRKLRSGAGLDYALLTGDFNPIHWLGPYARLAGFKRTILHGFGSLSTIHAALVRERWSGDPGRLRSVDVRFTRPLVLPATPKFFLFDAEGTGAGERVQGVAVGEGPGGPAYMLGTLKTHPRSES